MTDPKFETRAELEDALESALDSEVKDHKIEDALRAEGIFTWGPVGEQFERMFKVVMNVRRVTLAHSHLIGDT